MHAVGIVWSLDKVVGDRRMMRCVLKVVAGTIREAALICLSKKRVKRFVLSCANVEASYLGSNYKFESLEWVCAFSCLIEVF